MESSPPTILVRGSMPHLHLDVEVVVGVVGEVATVVVWITADVEVTVVVKTSAVVAIAAAVVGVGVAAVVATTGQHGCPVACVGTTSNRNLPLMTP